MLFYVTVVTFLMTLVMNKFTSIVISAYLYFIQISILKQNFIYSTSQHLCDEILVMNDWNSERKVA